MRESRPPLTRRALLAAGAALAIPWPAQAAPDAAAILRASARAIATRCRCPPESCPGR